MWMVYEETELQRGQEREFEVEHGLREVGGCVWSDDTTTEFRRSPALFLRLASEIQARRSVAR